VKFTLQNGIVLDDSDEGAKSLQEHAERKGLSNVRVFLSNDKGSLSYLLVIGENPEFESQQYEAIAVHIDIVAIRR
jgi:hypothetical protein